MKVLSRKDFEALAIEQEYEGPEGVGELTGFIDKYTYEAVIPEGVRTRIRTHEVGHEDLEHFPKSVEFYGKGKKDVQKILEPLTQTVDDEIEAEMYSYRVMDKKITPRVGLMALRSLLERGCEPYSALSLVIGRLRKYGIHTSLKDRRDLVGMVERAIGKEVSWKL